jgi:hypothetical protein
MKEINEEWYIAYMKLKKKTSNWNLYKISIENEGPGFWVGKFVCLTHTHTHSHTHTHTLIYVWGANIWYIYYIIYNIIL